MCEHNVAYDFIGFDEATHFDWSVVEYLMSRLRGKSQFKSRMVLTVNPDPDSWILKLILWYLDEQGYPIEEKQGVLRYFIRRDGDFIWADSPEELIKRYGDKVKPLSFTFIGSKLIDNPVLMENSPEYAEWLDGLNPVDKARLKDGNWFVRPQSNFYFKRDWLKKAAMPPDKAVCCRAWDKAASEPSDVNKYPDYTACIKMYRDDKGMYYILGDFHHSNRDKDLGIYGKFRYKPGQRDKIIVNQALHDSSSCIVVLSLDPGSAGVTEYMQAARLLTDNGIIVKKDPMPPVTSKLNRFVPFASACENGLVHIVESSFDSQTLDAFYKELESFDGSRSGKIRKDD